MGKDRKCIVDAVSGSSSIAVEPLRRAITKVLAAREPTRTNGRKLERLQTATHRIAFLVESKRNAQRLRSIEKIRSSLLEPVDPLELPWDSFDRFNVAHKEIYWTQWLASLLRPELDSTLASIALHALADTIPSESQHAPTSPHGLLSLRASDWRTLACCPHSLQVIAEFEVPASQTRLDIVLRSDDALVVMELKLDGKWNSAAQHEAYTKTARMKAGGRRVALVYITATQHSWADTPAHWNKLTWKDLGLALRRRLGALPLEGSAEEEQLRRLPALIMVQAIERHRQGLPQIDRGALESLDRSDLARLVRHFDEELRKSEEIDDD